MRGDDAEDRFHWRWCGAEAVLTGVQMARAVSK